MPPAGSSAPSSQALAEDATGKQAPCENQGQFPGCGGRGGGLGGGARVGVETVGVWLKRVEYWPARVEDWFVVVI